jgi:GDP-fucose transporter C1
MWQIAVTSPLTHNISGTAKVRSTHTHEHTSSLFSLSLSLSLTHTHTQACAQTILALQLSGEGKSFMWWMSNAMVLGGSLGYSLVKLQEMSQPQPPSAQAVQKA